MYTMTIYDTQHQLICTNNRMYRSANDIAKHFIETLFIYIDLLNGGQNINQSFKNFPDNKISKSTLDSNLAPQMAFVQFISLLHNNKYFDMKTMRNADNPNKEVFAEISELIHTKLPVSSRAHRMKVITTLQKFVVPGIGKIVIESNAPDNEKKLDAIDFPEDLVPEQFTCSLTSSIMDNPCYDSINKETHYDRASIELHLAASSKNPHTNTPLKKNDLISDTELQDSIQQFVRNAEFVAHLFCNETTTDHFAKYITQIKSSKTLEALKQSLKEIMLPGLMQKYKINTPNLFHTTGDLEKCLRRAASEASMTDLSILISLYQVNVNGADEIHGKTAAHWVAQRFVEAVTAKSKDLVNLLQDCIDLLVANGANLHLTAKNGKSSIEILSAAEPALRALLNQDAAPSPSQKR